MPKSIAVDRKLQRVSESPGGLVGTQISGPHPRDSDSFLLGWSPRFCSAVKLPSDVSAAGPRTQSATQVLVHGAPNEVGYKSKNLSSVLSKHLNAELYRQKNRNDDFQK